MDEDVEFYREDSMGNKEPRYYNRHITLIILYVMFGIILFCSANVILQNVVDSLADPNAGVFAASIPLWIAVILLFSWRYFLPGFGLLFANLITTIILVTLNNTTYPIMDAWFLGLLLSGICICMTPPIIIISLFALCIFIFMHGTGMKQFNDTEIRNATIYFSLIASASIFAFSANNMFY
jgi:hypothetical protein